MTSAQRIPSALAHSLLRLDRETSDPCLEGENGCERGTEGGAAQPQGSSFTLVSGVNSAPCFRPPGQPLQSRKTLLPLKNSGRTEAAHPELDNSADTPDQLDQLKRGFEFMFEGPRPRTNLQI